MSPALPQPDRAAQARILERIFERATVDARRRLPQHRDLGDMELHVEQDLSEAIVAVTRHVYREKLLDDMKLFTAPVTVPWSCTVTVTEHRTWWQRLTRRPARVQHVPASGTVKGYAKVEVTAQHFASYPDMRVAPPEFGAAVRLAEYSPGPALVRESSTYPDDGVATRRDLHPLYYDPVASRARARAGVESQDVGRFDLSNEP